MIFKKYYTNLIIRILILIITLAAFSFVAVKNSFFYTSLGLLILIVFEVILLIRYLNGINNQLLHYLEHLKENDPNLRLRKTKSPHEELNEYFEEILKIIEKNNREKAIQYNLLKSVNEHITIGLIIYDKGGKIKSINKAAKELFDVDIMRNISDLDKQIEHEIATLKSNDSKLYMLKKDNEIIPISIKLSKIKSQVEALNVVSFQNIKNELDEKEVEAWQQLIRILRHEIMNSVTPITTLTSTIKSFYVDNEIIINPSQINDNIITETIDGLNLIEERGIGLIDFVQTFKTITQPPEPKFKDEDIVEILKKSIQLMKHKLDENNIQTETNFIKEDIKCFVDKNLMEQVCINLIKNSIEALENITSKQISITVNKTSEDKVIIEFSDNGKGIKKEEQEQIFLPFYSTKANGSGIGLSFSRQILRMHKGTISVLSNPNKQTTFTLKF